MNSRFVYWGSTMMLPILSYAYPNLCIETDD